MFTHPEYCKQGIATKIFTLLVEDAKERQVIAAATVM